MKLTKVIFGFLMLFLASGAIFSNGMQEEICFSYTITQNDKTISPNGDKYILDKDTFEINIKLKMNTGVYINISEFKTMNDRAKTRFDFAKLLSTNGAWMGGAEHNNNIDKNVFLQEDENRWQYWFINENTDRFNSVEKDGDWYVGKRIVENFDNVSQSTTFSVKDSGISKLYVTMTYVTCDSKYTNFKEHQTESFVLEFK